MIKAVSSLVYTRDYFLHHTSTSDEFKKTLGEELGLKHQEALKQANISEGMRVLDVGCGRGEILIHCAKKGAEAVGIDYASAAIKLAEQALSRQPETIQKKIKLIQKDICYLPFSDESFDRIFFLDVIEHLTAEQEERVLREIKRVLKKGGFLILHTWPNELYNKIGYPLWTWPLMVLLVLAKGGNKFPPRKLESYPHDKVMHINLQNYYKLRKALRNAGFKTKFSLRIDSFPKMKFKDRLLYALYKAKPFSLIWPLNTLFCDHLWVVARRQRGI